MKAFSRMTCQQIINNHVVPTGAFYGKINLKYTRSIKIGESYVTDEKGYLVFNKNGSPKQVYQYKSENCEQLLYYSLETTKTYKDDKNNNWFTVWIAFENNDNLPVRWHEETLGGNALTRELQRFLSKKITQYLINNNMNWSDVVIKRPHVNMINSVLPKAYKPQRDYMP